MRTTNAVNSSLADLGQKEKGEERTKERREIAIEQRTIGGKMLTLTPGRTDRKDTDDTDVHSGVRRLGQPLPLSFRAQELHGEGSSPMTVKNDNAEVTTGTDGGKSHGDGVSQRW
ncbi:uncharacterized protein DS421_6g188520 [Arachis hypogaea]|nr:uncharacterized protein DS421_6g188520 [Arachis hypogaea]